MTNQLFQQAERDLLIAVQGSLYDPVVWEHSARVARMAQMIARSPEVATNAPNSEALTVAALYHDMGWVLMVKTGEMSRDELLLRPTTDLCREMAADWMEANLVRAVPGGVLERAVAVVRQLGDRRTELIEAHVLADADNLDQIGPQAICLMIRKCRSEGRTLEHLLASWQRQEEYHYWQARIRELLRFDATRSLAERRHDALRRFMADLAVTVFLKDVAELAGPSPGHAAPAPSPGAPSPKP